MHCFSTCDHDSVLSFFFFNATATTAIYTLSLHDALPIYPSQRRTLTPHEAARLQFIPDFFDLSPGYEAGRTRLADRKSTRLNSSHVEISYAVFCLKKKKKHKTIKSPTKSTIEIHHYHTKI